MQALSDSTVDPLGNLTIAKPKLSSYLTVDQRGFLRCYELYAGPLVGIHIPDADGRIHIFATFTSCQEPPNAKR